MRLHSAMREVKLLVEQREGLGVDAAALHFRHGLAEPVEVARGRVQHREPDHVRLDREPDLDQFGGAGEFGDIVALAARLEIDEGAAADPPR